MPNVSLVESDTAPPTETDVARGQRGWSPSWYGHQTCGCAMVRAAFWAGVKVTVWVAFAATVTACDTVIGAPPPGGVTVAVTVADWELPVVFVTSVLTVNAELLRSA